MTPSPVASLLVAALVVLRQPCARNRATARLLLERAAECDSLTVVEREACRNLADDLDIERPEFEPAQSQEYTTAHRCRPESETWNQTDFHATVDPHERSLDRNRRRGSSARPLSSCHRKPA